MNKLFCCLAIAFMTVGSAQAAVPGDAENILNHSRFVDSEHPCRVSFAKDKKQAGVTLFAQHQSGDQDCKITALLITKELSKHYPDLQLTRVSFFDEQAQGNSRFVVVGKDNLQAVDSGQKVKDVLAKLTVVRQNSPRAASARSNSYTTVTPVPSSSAVAAGLPGSAWSTIDFYSLIRARGQSLLAQNTVRVSTKSSEWVPTTITVQRGQMLWVDIKDDIGSSVRASDNAANIVPNQPGGALLARISEDGGMFVLEKASTPIFAPNNGQIFLLINHNTSEEQLVNVAKSVRLLVSH